MRALYIHASKFSYKVVKEAIENPPDPPGNGEYENCLVAFVTVEEGDDTTVARRAVGDMVSHAERVGASVLVIYPYAHLSSELARPSDAHRVLVSMEEQARAAWRGPVSRAPFGWYKAFDISCLGHPLSELSRQFKKEAMVTFQGLLLEEAIAKGLVDDWMLLKDPWDAEVKDVMGRLGAGEGERIMMLEAENLLMKAARVERTIRVAEPKVVAGIWGAASLLELCEMAGEGLASWGGAGSSLVATRAEIKEVISALNPRLLEEGKEVSLTYDDRDGKVVVYRSRRGGVPIAAEIGGKRCIGPVSSLVFSLVDLALKDAERGITPTLPPQLVPVQVALLPVNERHLAFVEALARTLKDHGVRTKIFSAGGLGSRIRETGRLWVPLVGTVGDKEVESNTISVRRRSEPGKQEVVTVAEFLDEAKRLRGTILV
ncbi:MAG: His/Gly/Thr/Pro-type tRNA ligase C-terminal domain-containing protein [Acidilobaceae archaeon]|nr:His/Gly/Thr/Pro-type tRNA ligase C-terminal domain-containing protein [Acidilobaceae archaeon]MDW7973940.1 threonyl-tRNA synthetase editing domain-containing protein [Sulfolobales archaeon]